MRDIFQQHHIPVFDAATDACFKMLRGYIDHGRFLRESGFKPSEKTSASRIRAKVEAILKAYSDISMLPHSATVELLKQYGFECAEYRLAVNYEEAKNAAERLGFPVILKGMVANVAHRSDAGLLSRKISNEAELQQEVAALEVKARQTTNGSAVISVEKYFPHDFEVILGVKYDATFGPVILCGLGGVFTEILKDYALRLAPLTTHDAKDMVSSLKAFPILEKAAALESLTDAILRLSDLAVELSGKITAVDINPIGLQAHSSEALVLDAKIYI